MYVLIVAATEPEIKRVAEYLSKNNFYINTNHCGILISGVGSMAAAYSISQKINDTRPGFIIQAGIAGSFDDKYKPGDVVVIAGEITGDMGAEENDGFKDIFDLGLMNENTPPFTSKALINPHIWSIKNLRLPLTNGVTVNEITTRKERIELLREKFKAQTESMEGAALHYVCLQQGIPFLQLRAISNYVGERNKEKWKIPDAIENLNTELMSLIENLNT